jgi:hypothetical protein
MSDPQGTAPTRRRQQVKKRKREAGESDPGLELQPVKKRRREALERDRAPGLQSVKKRRREAGEPGPELGLQPVKKRRREALERDPGAEPQQQVSATDAVGSQDPTEWWSTSRGPDGVPRPRPPRRFVYDPATYGVAGAGNHQVKYGPTEGLSSDDLDLVDEHVLGHVDKKGKVRNRLTQYTKKHTDYVEHAKKTGRGLTEQERAAAGAGNGKAAHASINHVVASGVGQNTLNASIAKFIRAGKGDAAAQAAAVARVQMYNRAFAYEDLDSSDRGSTAQHGRRPWWLGSSPDPGTEDLKEGILPSTDAEKWRGRVKQEQEQTQPGWWAAQERLDQVRNDRLRETLSLMEGKDRRRDRSKPFDVEHSYRQLLKGTFDSPANLRVGHGGSNTQILTGFDGETDATGTHLTERSQRLLDVHLAAAPDHDRQIVTLTPKGQALSSSKEATVQPTTIRPEKKRKRAH